MEETMVMNEQQHVENESKKANKNNTWKQVTIGGVAGIVVGGASTAAVAATLNHTPEVAADEEVQVEGVNGMAQVDSSVPVAQVSDDMTFGEAFASAHNQVGPGGVFVWHGQVYGTYTADEWNSMTPAEHEAFGNRVHVNYAETTPSQTTNVEEPVVTVEQNVTPAETEQNEVQVVEVTPAGNTDEILVDPVEVEILGCETVTNNDGSQMDIAVVSIDGQEMGLIDIDQNGTADVMLMDVNGDNQITENEMMDISSDGISMSSIQDQYLAQNDPSLSGPDYINDGNVESYMA